MWPDLVMLVYPKTAHMPFTLLDTLILSYVGTYIGRRISIHIWVFIDKINIAVTIS